MTRRDRRIWRERTGCHGSHGERFAFDLRVSSVGSLELDPVNGKDGAADALENPRFPGHLGECVGFGNAFFEREVPARQKLAKADGEDVEEPFRREAGFGEIAIAIGEVAGGVEALALGEPLEIAALAPESEVDLRDRGAIELRAEDGLNRRQSVEPGDEFPPRFAFEKAEIELFPDVFREMSKFEAPASMR
jgi:hypothetical protein